MKITINGEQQFQVLATNFSISPSNADYTLQISADGQNFSDLFRVSAGQTRMVTGVANGSYYRLKGNGTEVVINWRTQCKGEGGGGSATDCTMLKPVSSLPTDAENGTLVSLHSIDYTIIQTASGMANVYRKNFPAGYQHNIDVVDGNYYIIAKEAYATQEHFDNYEADTLHYGIYYGAERTGESGKVEMWKDFEEGQSKFIFIGDAGNGDYLMHFNDGNIFVGIHNEDGNFTAPYGGESIGDNRWRKEQDGYACEFWYGNGDAGYGMYGQIVEGDTTFNMIDAYGTSTIHKMFVEVEGEMWQVWVSYNGESNDYVSKPFVFGTMDFIDVLRFNIEESQGIPYTAKVRLEIYGVTNGGNYSITYRFMDDSEGGEHTDFERTMVYNGRGTNGNWIGYGYRRDETTGLWYKMGGNWLQIV